MEMDITKSDAGVIWIIWILSMLCGHVFSQQHQQIRKYYGEAQLDDGRKYRTEVKLVPTYEDLKRGDQIDALQKCFEELAQKLKKIRR